MRPCNCKFVEFRHIVTYIVKQLSQLNDLLGSAFSKSRDTHDYRIYTLYHINSQLMEIYDRIPLETSTASLLPGQERDRAAALVEGYEATSVTK